MGARPAREPGLLRPAVAWLAVLAPLFFASYGFATWLTGQRSDVGTQVFAWETSMPFWPWTVVPYWSIDLLYGLSLLLPSSRRELHRHGLRLLTAQLIAVGCFLIWPLRFSFERPETQGVLGGLFTLLGEFDEPFNQAPSLHIALLVILWVLYQRHASGLGRWLVHGWFLLIGVSVLTTYQHHFIDVPTGALLGWLCVWLWPTQGSSPLRGLRIGRGAPRLRLALGYGCAAALLACGLCLGGGWLWLGWPAVSLLLVALAYGVLDGQVFQKSPDGPLSPAARWLFAPYLIGAWVNARLWTRRRPNADEVVPGVWLGRLPSARQLQPFAAVVDLCAELPLDPQRRAYACIPMLDLIAPTPWQCIEAAHAIERLRGAGPLLVCCALGYSRSATAIAAWLLQTGRAANVDSAIEIIRAARPQVVLHNRHRRTLEEVHAL